MRSSMLGIEAVRVSEDIGVPLCLVLTSVNLDVIVVMNVTDTSSHSGACPCNFECFSFWKHGAMPLGGLRRSL